MVNGYGVLQFNAKISKSAGGGYRIWIPKNLVERIPDDLWVFDAVYIRTEGFKQTLKNPPCSRANSVKRYIPIYCESVETDYTKLGKVSIEAVYGV